MALGSLDPENDDFTIEDMSFEHGDALTVEFLEKLARNTGYLKRKAEAQRGFLFLTVISASSYEDFDSGRDYDDAYIMAFCRKSAVNGSSPYSMEDLDTKMIRFIQLSTSNQYLLANGDTDLSIKALGSPYGYRITNNTGTDIYLIGMIEELTLSEGE